MNYEALAVWSRIVESIITLVILVVLFRKYLLPPIGRQQAAKNAEIAQAEARRDTAKSDIEKARGEVESAKRDALRIRADMEGAAARERDRLVATAEDEGKRVLQNAQGELERARATAREQLRFDLIERALAQARAETRWRIDAGANLRIVESTVSQLEHTGADVENSRA